LKRHDAVADDPSGVVTVGAVVEISQTITPPEHFAYKYSQLDVGHDIAGVSRSAGPRENDGAAT
jgi:hypothetical protein